MDWANIFPSFSGTRPSATTKPPRISGKFRLEIYGQLATFIEDGFTPFDTTQVLAIEYGDSQSDPRGKAYRYLAKRLTQGSSISQALKGSVPQSDLYVLEAAEEIGSLDEGFRRLIFFSEKSSELKSNLFSLGQPIFMAAFALGILYSFSSFVIPEFAATLPIEELGLATTSLIAMGNFLGTYTLPVLAFFAVYFAISTAFLTNFSSPIRDKFLTRFLPPWNIYQMFVANSFLLTLGTMMESGIRLKEALEMIKSLSGKYLSGHIEQMQVLLSAGSKVGRAIAVDIFDKENKRLLRIYGKSDQFESKMQLIAQRSLEQSLKRVKRIVDLANIIIKLVIGLIIVWVVFALGGVIAPIIEKSI
jgi:toxin co-regulated pilus biosynthesis protein E